MRIMHEAQLWPISWFVTFTYSEDKVPDTLRYKDFQQFMRRLRRARPNSKVRFFCAGEYGEERKRPHFHAILFNVTFPDARTVAVGMDRGGYDLSRFGHVATSGVRRSGGEDVRYWLSSELDKLWSHGYTLIGALTFESAAYVARYVMDKVNGDAQFSEYARVDPETGEMFEGVPEMARMSLKPGIGYGWLQKYGKQAIDLDRVVMRGSAMGVPKYYLRKWDDAVRVEEIRYTRYVTQMENKHNITPERLAAREKIDRARAALTKRRTL